MFDDRRLGLNSGAGEPAISGEPLAGATISPPTALRLGSLGCGDVAIVAGVDSSQVLAKRLADLGFIPGVEVQMLRPGKPCLVRVNGICLGLGVGHQNSIVLGEPS